jgi:hypothetical protein
MMGGETFETRWATGKHQVINLWKCIILLVELFESYDDARTCERQISGQIFERFWNAKFQENLLSWCRVFMKVIVALGYFANAAQTYTLRNGSTM